MSGKTNIPKYHHFVPQMLLRRFTDANGKFSVYIKVANKIVPGTPESQFGQTHFHTVETSTGEKDTSAEGRLSELEGAANLVIEKIVAAARLGQTPSLTPEEKATWDDFLHLQWRRVPDLHAKVASFQDQAGAVDAVLAKVRAKYPDRLDEIAALTPPKNAPACSRAARSGRSRKRAAKSPRSWPAVGW
jgi:hypothetical protein